MLLLALLIAYPVSIHLAIINGYTITALLILLSAFILLFSNNRITSYNVCYTKLLRGV